MDSDPAEQKLETPPLARFQSIGVQVEDGWQYVLRLPHFLSGSPHFPSGALGRLWDTNDTAAISTMNFHKSCHVETSKTLQLSLKQYFCQYFSIIT